VDRFASHHGCFDLSEFHCWGPLVSMYSWILV
jgi:hypothetical protein